MELIHSDLAGPITPASLGGARYFILYIDDFSRVASAHTLITKTAEEITSKFQDFQHSMLARYPTYPITRFRSDNGSGEYDNRLFRGILRASGIRFEPSPPYTQHKNGVAERMIRTLTTKARAMMLDSRLDGPFWGEAINTAACLHARTPSQSVGGRTPYEMLNGKGNIAEIHHLRRFGCAAYKLIPEEVRRGKFSVRSRVCVMVDYVHETTKLWKLWDPIAKQTTSVSDVRFDETKIMGNRSIDLPDVLKPIIPDEPIDVDDFGDRPDATPLAGFPRPQPGPPKPLPPVAPILPIVSNVPAAAEELPQVEPLHTSNPRRSTRLRGQTAAAAAVASGEHSDPNSYRDAMRHENAAQWMEAMRKE